MKSFFGLLIFLLFSGTLSAQHFSTIIDADNIAWLRDYTIVTVNEETFTSEKLSAYSVANGRLKSFSFKTEDGVKHKLKAEQVKLVKARLTHVAKAAMIVESSNSIERSVTTDYADIVTNNLIRFNGVTYNEKKNKQAVLQLLNYGFDQKIKVYPDPASTSGTTSIGDVTVSGGVIKNYFVVKGNKTFKLSKKSYKKLYHEIFGACKEMNVEPKLISISNLCNDILKYNRSCN